jgi:hypothetical protein
MSKRPGFVGDLGRQLAQAAPRAEARRRRIDLMVRGVVGLTVIAGATAAWGVVLNRGEVTELVASGGDESQERAAAVEVLDGPAGWTIHPADAIEMREGSGYAIGGDQLFVWGGVVDRTSRLEPVGHLVDLDSGEIVEVPPAPIEGRLLPSVAWTGDAFILFGGRDFDGPIGDGAAFDPASQTWSMLSPAPFAGGGMPSSAWSGSDLVVWNPSPGSDPYYTFRSGPGELAVYDPATDEWELLAEPPIDAIDAMVFADERTVQLVGGPPVRDIGTEGAAPAVQYAVFDRLSGEWSDPVTGPDMESARAAQADDGTVLVTDASGTIWDASRGFDVVATGEPGCWFDVALAAGGGEVYVKSCGSVLQLTELGLEPILSDGGPGSTGNTYSAAFLATSDGALVTLGTPDPAAMSAALGRFIPE